MAEIVGTRILVVEDDAEVLRAVTRRLAIAGATVLVAEGYDAAMMRLRTSEPIELLLTDLVLTDRHSGLDVVVAAQEQRADLPAPRRCRSRCACRRRTAAAASWARSWLLASSAFEF